MAARRTAKSLIELLVVIAIIAILILLVLSAIQKVRLRAVRLQDENKMRQVALAAQGYQEQHGRLPPLIGTIGHQSQDSPIPVAAFLLPHLEQPSIDTLWKFRPNALPLALSHVVPAYVSSNDPSHTKGQLIYSDDVQPGVGNIAFNVQVFGPAFKECGSIDGRANLSTTFRDGTSNTIMLATKRGKCGTSIFPNPQGSSFWVSTGLNGHCGKNITTQAAMFGHVLPDAAGIGATFQTVPDEANCNSDLAQGLFTGGIVVGMADGSVQWVRGNIEPKIWRNGLLPGDGGGIALE